MTPLMILTLQQPELYKKEDMPVIEQIVEKYAGLVDEEGRTAYCLAMLNGNHVISQLTQFEKEIVDIYGKTQDQVVDET